MANKQNYQNMLERMLKDQEICGKKLLLHSCCGPCSTYCIETLAQYFEATVFYYNPNIYPKAEYDKRYKELDKVLKKTNAKYPISVLEVEEVSSDFHSRFSAKVSLRLVSLRGLLF